MLDPKVVLLTDGISFADKIIVCNRQYIERMKEETLRMTMSNASFHRRWMREKYVHEHKNTRRPKRGFPAHRR